jgi:hypothetical protein
MRGVQRNVCIIGHCQAPSAEGANLGIALGEALAAGGAIKDALVFEPAHEPLALAWSQAVALEPRSYPKCFGP